jgi:hypothetical protein|tara:strand:+ start:155 stop:397 length:243 start_codon:yes stop_codon:yes gene_type:complete
MRQTGECPSGDFASVLSVHCARRHLARVTGFESVLAIFKFEDEFTFEDQELSIELVTVEFGLMASRKANFTDVVASLTCQ